MEDAKCQGFYAKKDENGNRVPCTNSAKYFNESKNKYVCGVHADADDKKDCNLIKKTGARAPGPSKAAISSTSAKNKSREDIIFDAAMAAIKSGDPGITLSEDEIKEVTNLPMNNDPIQYKSVLFSAYAFSGSTNEMINGQGIANNLPRCIEGYRRAKYQKQVPIPDNFFEFPPRSKNSQYRNKNLGIYYPSVNMRIINCRNMEKFDEWLNDPKNIYMGPRYDILSEDSKWFIPLPVEEKLRIKHNKKILKEIIENIRNGSDDKEKYLALKEKTLGCLCLPNSCHCEVYVDVVKHLQNP
jgi:hypothetical protein